jgi:hypothetical protein
LGARQDDEPKSVRSIGEKSKAFDSLLLTKNKEKRRETKNGLRQHGRHISDDVSSFLCDEASRASSAETITTTTTTTAADRPAHTYKTPIHPSIHLPAHPNNQTEQTSFIYIPYTTRHHHRRRKQEKKMCIYLKNPYTHIIFFFFSPSLHIFFLLLLFLPFAIHFGSHLYPNPFVMLYQTISASSAAEVPASIAI